MKPPMQTSERAEETWRDVLRKVYAAIAFLSTVYFIVALAREVSFAKFVANIWSAESFLVLILGSVCTVLWLRIGRR